MYTQSPPLFEAPLAHEVVHAGHCNCRECRSNFGRAFAPGWAEREWEACVGPNPRVKTPLPPSRQQLMHHRRNPAVGLQPPLPPLTTPALSTPTKWMGSKPPGTTLYVNIPLGSEERGTTPMTGIFLPKRYRTLPKVDILLYLHGYKIAPNQPNNRWSVDWYWQNGPIGAFREELNNSYKNVVLVMPTLSGKSNPGWLVRPGGLDRYLDMVMAALIVYGPYRGKNATVGNIILVGHSGAGLYMRKLARSKHRYSPFIRECWGFDCMYNSDDADEWSKWARQNPKAKLYNYYIRGTPTRIQSEALPKLPNISVMPLNNRPYRSDLHHWVPIIYWRTRIERTPFLLNR
jgi:hypothetical protein